MKGSSINNNKNEIVIGTRGSRLALWQANFVKDQLSKFTDKKISLKIIKTTGDKILDSPLSKIGEKGLFVKEIEQALLSHEIDLAVHSMKDMTTVLPDGLTLAAALEREDPRDVLISNNGNNLSSLKNGAIIGTSSLRRKSQLLAYRKDFIIKDLRGNLDTRLSKLESGEFDGIILAGAGVKRLGYGEKISQIIDEDIIIHAVGQGAIAIETREDDAGILTLVSNINHSDTFICTKAERALMRELEGGCQVPIGASAKIMDSKMKMKALIADLEGETILRVIEEGDLDSPEELGKKCADLLIEKGAHRILEQIRQI